MKLDINELAKTVHQQNIDAGWWDDYSRPLSETLMLVISELSEAMEGARKDLMDDHLPHRKMYEVELADAVIRLLDLAGRHGWRYKNHIISDICKRDSIPSRLFDVCSVVTKIGCSWQDEVDAYYSKSICGIYECASLDNLDLEGAILEKLEYNKTRADHKRENRAKPGGKKF